MQSKTGNLIMAIGAVIAVMGLSILPAGLSGNASDRNLIGVGAAVFSMGAIFLALGLYLKASALKAPAKSVTATSASNRPIRGGCDRCQTEMPVIQCKVHQQHLCGTCLAEHYDFRSCVYSPSTRRSNVKSMAAKAR